MMTMFSAFQDLCRDQLLQLCYFPLILHPSIANDFLYSTLFLIIQVLEMVVFCSGGERES